MRKLLLILTRNCLLFAVGIILIVFLIILFVTLPTFFDTLNPTKQILIAAIISTILALIISYIGIKSDARIQYFDDLEGLMDEMQINYGKICKFPTLIEKNYIDWEKTDKWNWLPKIPSYTNWGDGENFHLKYCKSSAYFNFVNRGHITHNYLQIPTENIAHFYQFCILFSIELQKKENNIINHKESIVQKSDAVTLVSTQSSTTSSHLMVTSDKPLNSTIDDETNLKRQTCDNLKNKFYPIYADKNDLNLGIKGEYEVIREHVKKYFDLNDNKKEAISNPLDLVSKINSLTSLDCFLWGAFLWCLVYIIIGLFIIYNINSLSSYGALPWTWAFFFISFGFTIIMYLITGQNINKSETNIREINEKFVDISNNMKDISNKMKNHNPPQ